jgi:hypothetical protein
MNVEVNDKGIIELREVYGGVSLITKDQEKIYIAMRDSGFEFNYNGVHYEAKEGKIHVLGSGKLKPLDLEEKAQTPHVIENGS